MEYENVDMEKFKALSGARQAKSEEYKTIESMKADTVIRFTVQTVQCRYETNRSCSVASITQTLTAKHQDRLWSLRHESGTDYHLVACFAIDNTG